MSDRENSHDTGPEDAPSIILSKSEAADAANNMDDAAFEQFLSERGYNFSVPRELILSSGRVEQTFTSAQEIRKYLVALKKN